MSKAVVQCQCGRHYNSKFNRFCPACHSGVLMGCGGQASEADLAKLKERFAK